MSLSRNLRELINPSTDELKGDLGISASKVKVDGRNKFVYVRMMNNPNEIIQAYNEKVSATYGLPVILSYDGQRYNVEKLDVGRYSNWKADTPFLVDHAAQHSAIRGAEGADIVWVDGQQIIPLLISPTSLTGTLGVSVGPYNYLNSNHEWLSVGGTGFFGMVYHPSGSINYLIMLDDSDGDIYALTGSYFSSDITGTFEVLSNLPAIPISTADKPLAAVRVSPGVPINWANIYDLRQHVTSPSVGGVTVTETDGSPSLSASTLVFPTGTVEAVSDGVVKLDFSNIVQATFSGAKEDITDQVNGTGSHFIISTPAYGILVFLDGSKELDSAITYVPQSTEFDLDFVPQTGTRLEVLRLAPVVTPDVFYPSHYPLPVFAASGNTNWDTISAAAASDYYLLSDGTQNDEVHWNTNLPAGTYTAYLLHFTGNNRGIYTVYLDDVSIGTVDGYDAGGGIVSSLISDVIVAGASPTEVKIKMATKNGSSAAYYGLLFDVWLVRTGA